MARVTGTLHPLHFEDLEPHRFEDLVRQLIYDFRQWKRLEATGRSGSDDGFDVRAWQSSDSQTAISLVENSREDQLNLIPQSGDEDIQWLVQCKREKRIGPSLLRKYLDDIPESEIHNLHGILFVGACDFSKKARDAFREKCYDLGIGEWHIWGKAELEDMLFRPANDHLLFAYFNFSLQIRKNSLKSTLNTRLVIKRRAKKHLPEYGQVLLRDATDERYPWLDDDHMGDRQERGHWRIRKFMGVKHNGLYFINFTAIAYLDDDGVRWDFAECLKDRGDWNSEWPYPRDEEGEISSKKVWDALPEKNRALIEVICLVEFESIVAIDEEGDDCFKGPHVYTQAWTDDSPFTASRTELRTNYVPNSRSRVVYNPKHENRVEIFPREKAGSIQIRK